MIEIAIDAYGRPVAVGALRGSASLLTSVKHMMHGKTPKIGFTSQTDIHEKRQGVRTMSDLISREKLIKTIRPMVGIWEDETFWISYERVMDIIESAEPEEQTAKVIEQKPSGLPSQNYYTTTGFCEECGMFLEHRWSHCPGCGARLEWK